MTARLVRIWIDNEKKTAIIGPQGRKFTHFVIIEFPIRLRRMANAEVDRSTRPLAGSLAKAIREYLRIGRERGITKEAARFLKGVRA